MLHGSKVPGNGTHLVPCLVKAVQIIEALRTARAGLRIEAFLDATGYTRSTVYRILRTLMACDYVQRDGRGEYRLNQGVIRLAEEDPGSESGHLAGASGLLANGPLEFERWGVRFRCGGRRAAMPPRRGAESVAGNQREA